MENGPFVDIQRKEWNSFLWTADKIDTAISQKQHLMEHGKYLTWRLMYCTHNCCSLFGQIQKNVHQLLRTVRICQKFDSVKSLFCEKIEFYIHLPRPVVGSSQKSKTGFVSSSDANDNRFFSPPDNAFPLSVSPMRVLMQCNKPTFDSVLFTRAFFSCLLVRRSNLRFA